jgi:hypothetical protein
MCSAAWLFCGTLADAGGTPLVAELRDAVGRAFPVLDAVASTWLGGRHAAGVDPEPAARACHGATDVVIVGVESLHLDALIPRLRAPRIALLRHGPFEVDWDRVLANLGRPVELVDMDSFQRHAGPRSVLLTFVYGRNGHRTHVLPSWLRVAGSDVRTQFRSLIAWDTLETPMFVYPRWLVEAPLDQFTDVV